MENKLLYKIRITGRVQGVGFRWRAAHEAWKTGINGFVKNMSDGSVYIEAEGFSYQLNTFVAWCRKGPGTGFVDDVEIETCPPADFRDFTIEH
jgi:acylphosphatase